MLTPEKVSASNLIKQKHLFWEIDPNQIPNALIKNDDWVIVRVFEYGSIDDINDVIELYGEEKVKKVLSEQKLKRTAEVMAYLFLGIDRYNRYAL